MSRYERFILIDDNEADNVYHEIMIERAGFTGPGGRVGRLDKNLFDHLLSGLIRTLGTAVPLAKVLDTYKNRRQTRSATG